MNVQTKNTSKGFTIIEVVLVLAIAGLIFLMVFIALPALQRSQRDQARKNDVTTVSSAVNSYTSNNRGSFPSADDLEDYLGGAIDGGGYNELSDNTDTVTVVDTIPTTTEDATVTVVESARCGSVGPEGSVTLEDGTARQYVVITRLESGNETGFCLDS